MTLSPREAAEKAARTRFMIMNLVRFGAVAMVMVGFAITRFASYLSIEWIFGAALAGIGLLEFFFLPIFIAKRWKAADRLRDTHRE